jgi:hypothetical protein
LLTGVYGSGKSSAAGQIACLLEQRVGGTRCSAWTTSAGRGAGTGDRAGGSGVMLQNLYAVAANYRRAGIRRFVLFCFVRSPGEVAGVREALRRRVLASRMWSLATTVPPGSQRAM